ncbi:MAG: hypothetical protein HY831_01040 [Candidatus Aenigmarchaeota archaeon]|nr:hypothetical protein [Candidatus Aenigmarchaeota archaeon]
MTDQNIKTETKIKLLKAEKNMILLAIIAFIILSIAEIMFFFAFIKHFNVVLIQFMIYIIISTVFIGSAVWHIKHYRKYFSCSTGMMIGMTVGMMSGFMMGAIVGATNGMFIGSLVGLSTGIGIGVWCTRTCGIMSTLESMMAGLMSGTMGAMISVMLISDNILLFMPILIGICSTTLAGMSYMVYKEHEEHRENLAKYDKYDMAIYLSAMFMFAIILTAIMVWGPKSILTVTIV